ncbi:MAG: DUF4258 domain-containing protein [Gammaproteobacteria bacterium]|nr:DUF4258 domain-containing protein [Gammaproteobacteria bacterium]
MQKRKSPCWSAKTAERHIRAYSQKSSGFELAYTIHAKERIEERGIIISDVVHILVHGHIDDEPETSSRPGYCKYKICGKPPNSGHREICLVIIPNPDKPAVKVITVMWKDQP